MTDYETLSADIDRVCREEIERFHNEVPYARHLTGGGDGGLDSSYYVRHRIETVHRIRLTAALDAAAFAAMTKIDYAAARRWNAYAAEEARHDLLFLRDLRIHGRDARDVERVPPFLSTVLLVGYLKFEMDRLGPLAAVAYSVFVEWNSGRYSAAVVENAARRFSERHVKGARRHLGIDTDDAHYESVVRLAADLLNAGAGTVGGFFDCLRTVSHLFREYFRELYEFTVAVRPAAEVTGP